MPGFSTEANSMFEGGGGTGVTGGGIPPCITEDTEIYADTGSPDPQPHYLFLTVEVGWMISDAGCLIVQG